MNPEPREEWQALRAEQAALRAQLDRLEQRLTRFEDARTPAPPLPVAAAPGGVVDRPLASVPPPLPAPTPLSVAPAPTARESMEMRIGSDWLVRVGVVLLLTSLAFLGDYLYRNVVPRLGPVSKVGLLYLGSGLLAGVGAWLARSEAGREIPRVRNYGQVVLAGGLAAVYYVTYAAHYSPNLRVIGNPLAAGLLLVGWSAFMVWLADRRRSETLATFAILLAFYTSAVNEIAGFTLVSNLPLAAAAVFLLRRHLWKIFPFASLLATFGSYGYWRWFHVVTAFLELPGRSPLGVHASGPAGIWTEASFLLLYWLLFTWAVFTTPEHTLPRARRAGFASLNNGAFFLLVTWSLLEEYPGSFWKWALGFGVVLLALAELCRGLPPRLDRETENAFLLEGVLLLTVGFIAYFSGWQLSVVLAVQSVVLVAAAVRRGNPLLLGASLAAAVLAAALAAQELDEPDTGHFRLLGPAVAAMLAFDSWWSERSGAWNPAGWLAVATGSIYELLTIWLCVAWGEEYFPFGAKFSLFVVAGGLLFALGIESGRKRWTYWSYALTCVGLAAFWLEYGAYDHRQPLQMLGLLGLIAQQQFGRRRPADLSATAAFFPLPAQGALIAAAVLSGWVSWTALIEHWSTGGFILAAGWSLYAASVFTVGLVLRERVFRWLALVVLTGTLGHILLLDIWRLDSLERFFSLLCLGVVLLAIGFFYTRYQTRLRDLF